MRRATLLLVGLCAGGCVFALMILFNANHLPVYRQSAPVFTLQSIDGTKTTSAGPEYVEYLPRADITLPYPITGTSLVAEMLAGYDGPLMEDGSDREVVNAAALVLRNTGDTGVEQAIIILERGTLRLTFEISSIPPGGTVLAVETRGQLCAQRNFTACYGWAIQSDEPWLEDERVRIESVDMGSMRVTNISGETLEQVRISYKSYYAEDRLFLGGVTYQVETGLLSPGQTKCLQPGHYASDRSYIVRVQIE